VPTRDLVAREIGELIEHGRRLLQELAERQDKTFRNEYQRWYTRASAVVGQLVPDRKQEFERLYLGDSKRREINNETYTIADYLRGLNMKTIDGFGVTAMRFQQQFLIVAAAETRLDGIFSNMRGLLQVEILDRELDTAAELLRAGHVRASGAVAGVALERHLAQTFVARNLSLRKTKPTIADWNDALRNAEVYDTPTWRRVQHLADLRNLCVHPKSREPTHEEVEDLLRGATTIIKTVF